MSRALKAAIEANDPIAARTALASITDTSRKLPGASKPIIYACEKGADKVLEVLIDAGVNVSGIDSYIGNHPFIVAQMHKHLNAMGVLLHRKVTPDDVIDKAINEAARTGHAEVLKFIFQTARRRVTPMHFRSAASAKSPEILRILVEAGGNLNDTETLMGVADVTPLQSVVDKLNPEIVRAMVEFGANVNAMDSTGRTPLMVLAFGLERIDRDQVDAAVKMIELLAELGADGSRVDRCGNDALDYYQYEMARGRSEPSGKIVAALKQAGARGDQATLDLFLALRDQNLHNARAAIAAGADVNRQAPPHWSSIPLLMVRSLDAADLLLEAGADPNKAAHQTYPLISAADGGHLEVVKRLLEAGANLHAIEPLPPDDKSVAHNALTAAQERDHDDLVAYLKSLGATKPVLKWKPFEPGIESWNDFSELLVKAEPAKVAESIAKIIDGRILSDVYRQTVSVGRLAYVVIRPRGIDWSNVYRLAPQQLRRESDEPVRSLAAGLASSTNSDALKIEYSDTSDAVAIERFSPQGGTEKDEGWDYDLLKEVIDSIGKNTPKWAKDKLRTISPDTPVSTERLKLLAKQERFVAAAYSFGHKAGTEFEIEVPGYPAEAFDPVFVITV